MRTQDLDLPLFERKLKTLNGWREISLRVNRHLPSVSSVSIFGDLLLVRINPNLFHSPAEWEQIQKNLVEQIGGMK